MRIVLTVSFIVLFAFAVSVRSESGKRMAVSGLIGYQGGYESNIYHVDADSLEVSAYVHRISLSAAWDSKLRSGWTHKIGTEFELDAYQNNSNRNKSTIGLFYQPTWQYRPNSRLRGHLEVARRNKDLIDDTGTQETRTLKRWQLEFGISHRIDIGSLRLEQEVSRQSENYDEEAGSTSYDYASTLLRADATLLASERFRIRGGVEAELRAYDARKTYTQEFGAFVNRPFAVREYDELTLSLEPRWTFSGKQSLALLVEYADRTDNFENFYGYLQRRYQIELNLRPGRNHETTLSIESKNKDYANFWNSSVGRNNRVFIDYLDLVIGHDYDLSQRMMLSATVRLYQKESNYLVYQYSNLSLDVGVRYAW